MEKNVWKVAFKNFSEALVLNNNDRCTVAPNPFDDSREENN